MFKKLGYFEHWRLGYYLASTGRDHITHWRSVISQTKHIRCYTAVIFSEFPALRLRKMIWSLWLTEQLLASQDWACRVDLVMIQEKSLWCRDGQKLKSRSDAGYWVKTHHLIVNASDGTCSLYGPALRRSREDPDTFFIPVPWCTSQPFNRKDHSFHHPRHRRMYLLTDGSSATLQDANGWTLSVAHRDSCNPWYVGTRCFVIGPNETRRQVSCFVVGPESTDILRIFRGYDVQCKTTRDINIHVNRS